MVRLLRCLVALGCVALVAGAASAPASAHGDEGTMTVLVAEQRGANRIRLEVVLVYANDDDLAVDAAVTATLAGPGGATVRPVPLLNGGPTSARYVADVDLPIAGIWEVTITAEAPSATATTTVEVREAPAPTTTAPTTTAPTATSVPARSNPGIWEGGDRWPWLVIAAAAAAVVGAAGVAVARRARQARGASPPP